VAASTGTIPVRDIDRRQRRTEDSGFTLVSSGFNPRLFRSLVSPQGVPPIASSFWSHTLVNATVEAVMPCLGLAYLVDDDSREWTVSKSTRGADLTVLKQGQRLQLDVEQHDTFSYVRQVCD
jgi:hypothetical protein